MGEARRKKQLGITEPSNPNWKRRKKWTRRDEAELQQEVMAKLGLLSVYSYFRGRYR